MEQKDFDEIVKEVRKQQEEHTQKGLVLLEEAYKNKDWEKLCDLVGVFPGTIPWAFDLYYEDMPIEYRRDFVIGCYSHVGDGVPGCRKALRSLPKNGINELPEQYRNTPFIYVYRGGEEEITKAKYRISWTLDQDTAYSFLKKAYKKTSMHLYKGKIKPEDVIAYSNDRNEFEVMQYGKVYDIEQIDEILK